MNHEEQVSTGRINQVLGFKGWIACRWKKPKPATSSSFSGLDTIGIGVHHLDRENPVGLPVLPVDEPTLNMDFMVNARRWPARRQVSSPAARSATAWPRNCLVNVACASMKRRRRRVPRLRPGRTAPHHPAGNMRREGFELAVGKPRVVYKEINGEKCEPYEPHHRPGR